MADECARYVSDRSRQTFALLIGAVDLPLPDDRLQRALPCVAHTRTQIGVRGATEVGVERGKIGA